MTRILTVALLMLLVPAAWSEVNPDLPIEYVPFQPATLVAPEVSVTVTYQGDLFVYSYSVRSGQSSRQKLKCFDIGTNAEVAECTGPPAWTHAYITEFEGPPTVMCAAADVDDMLDPGQTLQGIVIKSRWAPGVGLTYSRGDVPPPQGQQVMLPPPPGYSAFFENDSVKVKTVVPTTSPDPTFDPQRSIDRMISLKHEAFALGWITNQGIVNSLDAKLDNAKAKLREGKTKTALNILGAFQNELRAQRGKHVKEPAYALLDGYAQSVIAQLSQTTAQSGGMRFLSLVGALAVVTGAIGLLVASSRKAKFGPSLLKPVAELG